MSFNNIEKIDGVSIKASNFSLITRIIFIDSFFNYLAIMAYFYFACIRDELKK